MTCQVTGKAVGQTRVSSIPPFRLPGKWSSGLLRLSDLLPQISDFQPLTSDFRLQSTGNGVPAETITPAKPSTKTAGSVLGGWWLAFTKTSKGQRKNVCRGESEVAVYCRCRS